MKTRKYQYCVVYQINLIRKCDLSAAQNGIQHVRIEYCRRECEHKFAISITSAFARESIVMT